MIFLFTDIEGSTRKWEVYGEEMNIALQSHDGIAKDLIKAHRGILIKHTGDGLFAYFRDKRDSLICALSMQKGMQNNKWGAVGEVRIRIALHEGDAVEKEGDFFGPVINKLARMLSCAHGGQIIASEEIINGLPDVDGLKTLDLGFHKLKDFEEPVKIYQLDREDLKYHEFPKLNSLSAKLTNAVVSDTAFLGREKELAEVKNLLISDTRREITLTGPGGTGKTRFSLELGFSMLDDLEYGFYFVQLEKALNSDDMIREIAASLSFNFYAASDIKVQLFNFIKAKKMLLILDNFEHLESASGFVSELLAKTDHARIIVTSRHALNIKGESVYPLSGLPFASGGNAAAALFGEHLKIKGRNTPLSPDENAAVADLCALVHGNPLAIELSASLAAGVPVTDLLAAIKKNMDTLSDAISGLPERHRGPRHIFEYSWGLLGEGERKKLAKMSLLRDPFSVASAEAVAGCSLGDTAAFIKKSLLFDNGEGRFSIHGILKQYAGEKFREFLSSDEKESALYAYKEHFIMLLKNFSGSISSAGQYASLNKIRASLSDIKAASAHLTESDLKEKRESIETLFRYYDITGLFSDGIALGKKLLGLSPDEEAGAFIYLMLAKLELKNGRYDNAVNTARTAQKYYEMQKDEKRIAEIGNITGVIFERTGDEKKAIEAFEKSRKYFESVNDGEGLSEVLNNLGNVYIDAGDRMRARSLFERSLEIKRSGGFAPGLNAAILNNLGNIEFFAGNEIGAREYYRKSFEIKKSIGDDYGCAGILVNLANLDFNQNDLPGAERKYREALMIYTHLGNRTHISKIYYNLGNIYYKLGDHTKAGVNYDASLKLRYEQNDIKGAALVLNSIGLLHADLHDIKAASGYFISALRIFLKHRNDWAAGHVHNNLAELFIKTGAYAKALSHNRKALRIFVKKSDVGGIITAHRNYLLVYEKLNKPRLRRAHRAALLRTALGSEAWKEEQEAFLEFIRDEGVNKKERELVASWMLTAFSGVPSIPEILNKEFPGLEAGLSTEKTLRDLLF